MTDENDLTHEVEAALSVFSSAETSPENRRAAFSALVDAKKPSTLSRHPSMLKGLELWLHIAREGATPEERLLAISEAMRVGQTFRRLLETVQSTASSLTSERWALPSSLPNSADRLNIARAIEGSKASWIPAYCADAIINEEAGENARTSFVKILLSNTTDVAETLGLLADAASNLLFDTENPGDSAARRFIRIAAALDASIRESQKLPGTTFGSALQSFARSILRPNGPLTTQELSIEVLKQASSLIVTAVRSKFTVATDPESYSAIRYLRGTLWKSSFSKDALDCLEELRKSVEEAIILLGRQGVASQLLLDQLALLSGGLPTARARTSALAGEDPHLPEDIRHWLRRGKMPETRRASDDMHETVLSQIDEVIGEALRAFEATGAMAERRQRILESIEMFAPDLEPDTRQLMDIHVRVRASIKSIASIRSLGLLGTIGGRIEFSPKYFDTKRALKDARPKVMVQAVVRLESDGSLGRCILRGEVE